MVFCEELNAYKSFNVAIDFEDRRFSLCRIPNGVTLNHMCIIIRSHLMGPFEPPLSHLWYHVPPEFVEEGIGEFLFVRNDEDLQHAIQCQTETCFFFLKTLRRHVMPQQNLYLMSDHHNSISAAFNKPNSDWTEGNCVQVFCIRHIAQNFTKRFKNTTLKNDSVNMGKVLHVKICLFSFFWRLIIHLHY